MELWRRIPGWPAYEASTEGRIRRGHRVLACSVGKKGYRTVSLSREGEVTCRNVHSLVLAAFAGPRPDGMECCHNNGVRADCRLANLRYDTRSNNAKDKRLHGTAPTGEYTRGERNGLARLTEDAVRFIRANPKLPLHALATRFGVHFTTVHLARIGRTWSHV